MQLLQIFVGEPTANMHSNIIEAHKKSLRLTAIQKEILVGLLLGDGHLETDNNGRTYRLKVEHSLAQKGYTDWLYDQFRDLTRQGPKQKQRTSVNGNRCDSYWFTTYGLGLFRFYGQQFYVQKKKIIPAMIGKLITPLSLAIWFMDDGSLKSTKHHTYVIHSIGFSKSDLENIALVLKKKFGFEIDLHRQGNTWRIYIPSRSAERFRELIDPYILDSMRYKLGQHMPKE